MKPRLHFYNKQKRAKIVGLPEELSSGGGLNDTSFSYFRIA
jgi:hypothetical protein